MLSEMRDPSLEPTFSGPIVITGGSGFLGLNLANYLAENNIDVTLISRHEPLQEGPWKHFHWDGRSKGDWWNALDRASGIVNLAGRTVDCIKTPDHSDEILRSRVESTLAIGDAIRNVDNPPKVWVQMSTAHIYGDPPSAVCDETSSYGLGLAPKVGTAWEQALKDSIIPEMREVRLRTSFVLGRHGGALGRLSKLARFGLGGKVGTGAQGISWIHEKDMNRLFWKALTDPKMEGAFLATAPNPVSNAIFMSALRKALHIPIGLPAAEWMVRIGAPLIMKTDPELALYGRYCVSRRLEKDGFQFEYPDIASAMKQLFL